MTNRMVLFALGCLCLGFCSATASYGDDPPAPDQDKKLLYDLGGEDLGDQAKNPLLTISKEMRAVEGLLSQQDSSAKTQEMQKQIMADLAKLIEKCERQCNGPGGKKGGGKPAAKPAVGDSAAAARPVTESTDRVEKSDKRELNKIAVQDLLRRVWGHLPDHLREPLMRGALGEQFLPKYEKEIEEYYRRLAEAPDVGGPVPLQKTP